MRSMIVIIGIATSLAANPRTNVQTFSSETETRRVAYQYATCAVNRHLGAASKAVLRNVDSLILRTHFSALIDPVCLDRGRLVFPGEFYIYALADALVARELKVAPVPDLSNVPPLERRSIPTFTDLKRKFGYDAALQATYDADVFGALDEFGECVVRKSPADAKALLMTEPGSAAEPADFDALQPGLSECAPEGKTMEFRRVQLRGTIALNYYRLAHAALQIAKH
jgi:hypothetical protein